MVFKKLNLLTERHLKETENRSDQVSDWSVFGFYQFINYFCIMCTMKHNIIKEYNIIQCFTWARQMNFSHKKIITQIHILGHWRIKWLKTLTIFLMFLAIVISYTTKSPKSIKNSNVQTINWPNLTNITCSFNDLLLFLPLSAINLSHTHW